VLGKYGPMIGKPGGPLRFFRAYSLLELLASLVVMATLAAVIVPVFGEFQKRAAIRAGTSTLQEVEFKQREHFAKKSMWGSTSESLYMGERLKLVSGQSGNPSTVSLYEYQDRSLGLAVLVRENICVYRLVYDPLIGTSSVSRTVVLDSGGACTAVSAKQ